MPVDSNVDHSTVFAQGNRDVPKEETFAVDAACYAQSDICSSDDEGDYEYEEASTRKVSQISTGILHPGGAPSNIHMENTSDVQIGPRLHYNAPVTINQYVHVLGNNEVTQDDILHEAVKAPLHGIDPKRNNAPQATLIGAGEKVNGISNINSESHHCNGTATNYGKVTSFCIHRRICLTTLAAILLLAIIITLIVHFSSISNVDSPKHTFYPPPADPEPNPNTTLPNGRFIYSKDDWSGAPPKYVRALQHPTPFIVISHTATVACYSSVSCAAQMRNFQDAHMGGDLNLPDIGYNFVAGGDGNVYEGRGWDATNMHTGYVMRCNIAISLIGNFVYDTPTNGQIEAVHGLIDLGVSLGKIDENYKLVAMNETGDTLSPGVVVYSIIAKWPHFWKPSHDDVGTCPYTV